MELHDSSEQESPLEEKVTTLFHNKSLASVGQRVVWGFYAGADLDGGRDAGRLRAAEMQAGEVVSVQGHLEAWSERIRGRSAH